MSAAETRLRMASAVMQVDALTVAVVGALRADGVRAIVLKGPAIASWLYDEVGDRQYADSDLLVSPDSLTAAEATLGRLGFARGQAGWLSKSREWRSDRGLVDLHASLFGIEVDDATAWALLSADSESLELGGSTVDILGRAARALHLATHGAQHDRSFAKAQADLERGLSMLPTEAWREAAELAERLQATATFVAGLRRAGAEHLLQELGLAGVRVPAVATLLAGEAPPTALGISQLAAAPTVRDRLSVLRRSVVPHPNHMRRHYPAARRGRRGLAVSYATRILHLMRHLPDGLRAWRRARSTRPRGG